VPGEVKQALEKEDSLVGIFQKKAWEKGGEEFGPKVVNQLIVPAGVVVTAFVFKEIEKRFNPPGGSDGTV
jgi:hypothetical protein